MRLIDADKLGIGKANPGVFENKAYADGWNSAIEIINAAPTIDIGRMAVQLGYEQVVRCKDCEYSYEDIGDLVCSHGVCVDCIVPPNFYCAEGKRRDEDDNQ